jgi:hypothetical protein
MLPISIIEKIQEFGHNFNNYRLDEVIDSFHKDAFYRTIQGEYVRGREEIRKHFKPQFEGCYGRMHFQYTDLLVDTNKRKATFVWTCEHNFKISASGLKNNLVRWIYRIANGTHCFWYGLDVFHLDLEGKILSKESYTTSRIPRMFKGKGAR